MIKQNPWQLSKQSRRQLIERLRLRLPALQQAVLAPANGSVAGGDVLFTLASEKAAAACFDLWLLALCEGEPLGAGTVPLAVRVQARRAASSGVSLSVLTRGYSRARDLVWRVILQEIEHIAPTEVPVLLRQFWAATESLLESLLVAIEHAYAAELETPDQRQVELVRRLLAGDRSVDTRMIRYEFDGEHLGLIATPGDRGTQSVLKLVAERAGCRLFCLPEQDGTLEAWLTASGRLNLASIERHLPKRRSGLKLAVGQARKDLEGFCRTHRQAAEALMVAERLPQPITWHRDVEIHAHLLAHQDFAESLIARYIAPLEPTLQRVLRVYYFLGRDTTEAAESLKIDRSTMRRRLIKVAACIGQSLEACHANVELALCAVDLGIPSAAPRKQPK